MELDFTHYTKDDWQLFQNAVKEYFHELKEDIERYPKINEVRTKLSGDGADGGRDILVSIVFNDSINTRKIKWVIQCKCYNETVGLKDLYGVDIPTLVHSFNADGYLLVCKGRVSSGVTQLFERLEKKSKMGYKFVIWTGMDFINNILKLKLKPDSAYYKQFFNQYHEFMKQQSGENKKIKDEIIKGK